MQKLIQRIMLLMFLQVVYGDSTKEQIVVPMVEVKDAWKMR